MKTSKNGVCTAGRLITVVWSSHCSPVLPPVNTLGVAMSNNSLIILGYVFFSKLKYSIWGSGSQLMIRKLISSDSQKKKMFYIIYRIANVLGNKR